MGMSCEEWGQNPRIVLRVMHEAIDSVREEFLKDAFGADVMVFERDIGLWHDAALRTRRLLSKVAFETGCEIAAIEVKLPIKELKPVLDVCKRLGVMLIRAESVDGKFSHYGEVLRIGEATRRLDE